MADGLRLTLRQLYYQLVAADVIPNNEKQYKRIGELISHARLAGIVDWDAIEDRVRRPSLPSEWDSLTELIEIAANGFQLPRREGQETYVEIWIEKDALAGVLRPLAAEFHCPIVVNRGYTSQSAMYESATRFREASDGGQDLSIVYIGDHDPSGEDMVRDVADRLEMFGIAEVEVEKAALTMTQIKSYKPPPNPAKLTDSRAAAYIRKHGNKSWEVDALPPRELQKIVRKALTQRTDLEKLARVVARENRERKAVAKKLGIKLRKTP